MGKKETKDCKERRERKSKKGRRRVDDLLCGFTFLAKEGEAQRRGGFKVKNGGTGLFKKRRVRDE